MKKIIICASIHHGNTEKIAKSMAEALDAELIKSGEVNINELSNYDLIGFGSGIYFGQHHKSLLKLVDNLPELKGKKAFIFSTSGASNVGNFINNAWHKVSHFHVPLRGKLIKKGLKIIGEFNCKGFDTFGPFKLVGGINKGKPNENDLKKARDFVMNLNCD